eukprot:5610039-Lingulodinium_polyedra.AAC.1
MEPAGSVSKRVLGPTVPPVGAPAPGVGGRLFVHGFCCRDLGADRLPRRPVHALHAQPLVLRRGRTDRVEDLRRA